MIYSPEEWVRQQLIHYLTEYKDYPASLIQVEKEMHWNKMRLRTDILVFSSSGSPLMIVECKAPEVQINNEVFEQIAKYNQKYKVPYLLVSNGMKHYCCEMDYATNSYRFINNIPDYKNLG